MWIIIVSPIFYSAAFDAFHVSGFDVQYRILLDNWPSAQKSMFMPRFKPRL